VALGASRAAAPAAVTAVGGVETAGAVDGGVVVVAGGVERAVAAASVTDDAVTARDSVVHAASTSASTSEDMARHFVTGSLPLIAARVLEHRTGGCGSAGRSTTTNERWRVTRGQ
jgi:hypothetical protein